MSGIDWLGEINPAWDYAPLFSLGNPKKMPNKGMAESNLLSLSYGKIIRRDIESSEGLVPASYETYQIVEPGDTVLRFTDLQNDQRSLRSGLVTERGIITSAYMSFTPSKHKLNPAFFAYLMRAVDLSKVFYRMGSGVRQSLNWSEFSLIRLPLPPLETQRRIADYLDRETAEIDAAVADLDRYVELLEKRRRAVVHEALTFRKGPGSGTQISAPKRGRVGFVVRLLRRGISPDYVDDGMPVINQKCIRPGGFLAMDNCRFHGLDTREISSNLTIQPGDTLINSTGTGTLGRSCMVRETTVPTTWDSHVTLVRPNTEIVDPGYLGWTILSQESKLIEFSAGSTNQIELSRDTVFNLDFVNIPLILQREIAAYLDHETAEIDSLIADSTSLRDLLLKRRSVLITEVVTGRKQV